jgi:hypothetical protein
MSRGLGDGSPPVGSRGEVPVGVWGEVAEADCFTTPHPLRNIIGSGRISQMTFGVSGVARAPFAPYWLRHWHLV